MNLFIDSGPGGPTDPLFSTLMLLLPFDGPDGTFTTADLSPTPKTVTFQGTAEIKAARAKFGSAGLDVASGGGAVDVGVAADWKRLHDGTTAWTLEGWVQPTAVGITDRPIIDTNGGTTANIGVYLAIRVADDQFSFFITRGVGGSPVCSTAINAPTGVVVADNVPHFLRVTYDPALTTGAGVVEWDGVTFASIDRQVANTPSSADPTNTLKIGAGWAGGSSHGGFDDFRITPSIRTGPAPTAAFPTS